jgi:hypothetical protein
MCVVVVLGTRFPQRPDRAVLCGTFPDLAEIGIRLSELRLHPLDRQLTRTNLAPPIITAATPAAWPIAMVLGITRVDA